jgi:hypothetical protein
MQTWLDFCQAEATMINMKLFLILGLSLTVLSAAAQDVQDSSSVVVHKDSRIDLLIKKQSQINEESSRNMRKSGKGFRLMVINTNKRDEAMNAKAKLYNFFPELKSYLYYQSPYFKLKAGNFKEKKDAEDYQQRLNKIFPKGVFVMPDIIEMKPEKESDDFTPNQ